jgi:hypothetical protein
MKALRFTLALAALALPLRAAPDATGFVVKPEELRNVPTVALSEVAKNLPKYDGKLVKVKFASRHEEIEKLDGELYGGQIDFWDRTESYGTMEIFFPKRAYEWFSRISNDVMARKSNFAYVRIVQDGTRATGLLVGREIKTGTKGAELVW